MSHSLPDGWSVKPLGEIFEFKNGFNADKSMYGKGKRFINVMEIINNKYLFKKDIPGEVELSESDFSLYSVFKGDVLFNRTSETPEDIGMTSVYLDDEPVVFGGFVIRARPLDETLDHNFCKYCFSTKMFRKQVVKRGQGAIRANIGQGDLATVPMRIPSKVEQVRISEILSSWDNSIDTTLKLIKLKIEAKSFYLKSIFSTNLCLNGNKKDVFLLDDLFKQRNDRGGDGELLSVTRERGIIPQAETEKKDTSNSDKSKYLRVVAGDLVYNTMRMWQGVSAVSRLNGLVSPAYTVCSLRKSEFNIDYFGYFFKSKRMIYEFHRRSQGLVDDTLNLKFENFRKIPISVHPPKQQEIIANYLHAIDFEIMTLSKKVEALKSQREALVENLLSGQKRVGK